MTVRSAGCLLIVSFMRSMSAWCPLGTTVLRMIDLSARAEKVLWLWE